MKRMRQFIAEYVTAPNPVQAVVVSHIHTDHISYYPLRVLEDMGIDVYVHEDEVESLRRKHFREYGFRNLKIKTFSEADFTIGDLVISPFAVPHHPQMATSAFQISHSSDGNETRAVVATDFNDWQGLEGFFADCNFIFLESNHDLELLRRYYNPNSRFHLPNPQTARLVHCALERSSTQPMAVMLGHLSPQRNEINIALEETRNYLMHNNFDIEFDLLAAPLNQPSEIIRIS